MAAVASQGSSRFAGIRKKYSEKFTQPELDADGRVKQVNCSFSCSWSLLFSYAKPRCFKTNIQRKYVHIGGKTS